MTDQILSAEHIGAIRSAHDTVIAEIYTMPPPGNRGENGPPFGPPGYYDRRMAELCPAAALSAWERFLDDRREAAKHIDPLTCNWAMTFTNCLDPYGITGGEGGTIERDFVVWDDSSNGKIQSCDLSSEQYEAVRERIQREARGPVLSSFVMTPAGVQ